MPEEFTKQFAEGLDRKCSHKVIEAKMSQSIEQNTVYIAPGNYHIQLTKTGHIPILVCNDGPEENGHKPSADVLFHSAQKVYGSNTLALILTGMGNDGCKGLIALKERGATVIAQDKTTSTVWGMPGSAVKAGCTDVVLPFHQIPQQVKKYLKERSNDL